LLTDVRTHYQGIQSHLPQLHRSGRWISYSAWDSNFPDSTIIGGTPKGAILPAQTPRPLGLVHRTVRIKAYAVWDAISSVRFPWPASFDASSWVARASFILNCATASKMPSKRCHHINIATTSTQLFGNTPCNKSTPPKEISISGSAGSPNITVMWVARTRNPFCAGLDDI
jgi:hypothetical protein